MPSPQEAILRGKIGGLTLAATHDPREYTAAARRTFLAKFLDAQPVDLPEDERQRRAQAARRVYFARLSYASAVARRERVQRRNGGAK